MAPAFAGGIGRQAERLANLLPRGAGGALLQHAHTDQVLRPLLDARGREGEHPGPGVLLQHGLEQDLANFAQVAVEAVPGPGQGVARRLGLLRVAAVAVGPVLAQPRPGAVPSRGGALPEGLAAPQTAELG